MEGMMQQWLRADPMTTAAARHGEPSQNLILALAALAAVVVAAAINPVGFIGGGQDDGRYLEAARCWAAQGPCLPRNHWDGRWPVFAPISLAIRLFGESRFAVQLWPAICSFAAVFLMGKLGVRLFGYAHGLLATAMLVATPIFALRILTPSVEAIELCFVLAAALCVLNWRDHHGKHWAFAAGLCFGLAFQVRETAIVAVALAVLVIYGLGMKPRLADIALAAIGFGLPLAIEFVVYQQAAGDFLLRRRLSLAHTQIPSTNLATTVDRSGSPLFNPEIIGGYRRESGIRLHWLVDGPLSLLVDGKGGFSLTMTPILFMAGRRTIPAPVRRAALWLLGIAAAYIAAITYGLAMNPHPRVMMPALVASSFAFSLVSITLFREGKKLLVAACWGSAAIACFLTIVTYLRPVWAERQALIWNAKHPQAIEIDRMTRQLLTLAPDARALPNFRAAKRYAMIITNSDCDHWLSASGIPAGALSVEGEKGLTLAAVHNSEPSICLFRYRRPVSSDQMNEAVNRSW